MLAVWTGTTYQIGVPAWLDGAVKLPIIIAVRANSTAVSTALEPDEMLMEVELPVAQPRSGACFMEVSRRRGDFAIIGVACTVRVDEEARCSAARIGLCNAGDMPIFAAEASEIFTKPYTPKTNGKAERFIQTALREWAYARAYQNSDQRSLELLNWLHRYNWHRPHGSLKANTPISRLGLSENNLLRLHS